MSVTESGNHSRCSYLFGEIIYRAIIIAHFYIGCFEIRTVDVAQSSAVLEKPITNYLTSKTTNLSFNLQSLITMDNNILDTKTPRMSEKEMEEVIKLASQMYAEHDSTISLEELLTAGNGTDIPERFIKAAHQEVIARRKIFKLDRKHQPIAFAIIILFTSILSVSFYALLSQESSPETSEQEMEKPVPPPEPVAPPKPEPPPEPELPSRVFYVQSLEQTWFGSHDGNPTYDIAVYREGKSGHVTKVKCILPPDTVDSDVKAIIKVEDVGFDQYLCTVAN